MPDDLTTHVTTPVTKVTRREGLMGQYRSKDGKLIRLFWRLTEARYIDGVLLPTELTVVSYCDFQVIDDVNFLFDWTHLSTDDAVSIPDVLGTNEGLVEP